MKTLSEKAQTYKKISKHNAFKERQRFISMKKARLLIPLQSKYDPTDIATDEEMKEKVPCNCLIHGGRNRGKKNLARQPVWTILNGEGSNYMTYWSDWGDPLKERL